VDKRCDGIKRDKKETGFVDLKITCLPCTSTVRGLLQAWKKRMGLIPVAMMKWMEILNIFLREWDPREVNPMGTIEIGTSPLQKMKGVLHIKGDRVNSPLEFPPLFLPCQIPIAQHLLSCHTE
jgi:hypothetical protein